MDEVDFSRTGNSTTGGCPFHNLDWGWISTVKLWQTMYVVLIAALALGSYLWIFRFAQRNVPGPKGWPLVGCVPELLKNWENFFDFLLGYFEQGHDSVCLSLPFGQRGIYVCDPNSVEYILKTKFSNYPKGLHTMYTGELLGEGIFGADGEAWQTQRKVASLEFSSAVLRDFSTRVFLENGLKLLRIVSQFAESNQPMDLQDLFLRMTLDSTFKQGFGVELGCLDPSLPAVPFAKAFDRVSELSYRRYIDFFWMLKRKLRIGEERELDNCVKVIDSFSYDVIRKRKEELGAEVDVTKMMTKPDLLSRFMSLKGEDDKTYYTDQALRDVIVNFILAGRDTSGLTLSWFMYRLCLHPEVADKIREEIRALEEAEGSGEFGERSGDPYVEFAELLTYRNVGKLQYLHAAISEALRLHPAVPLDGKTALADDILPNGTIIRRGTMVTYCAYPMGRLERLWGPDAKEFKPERWLKDGIFQPESPFKFTTFHAGPRACLGKDSAYLQMKMTAALLVKFFKFQLVPGQEITYRTMLVLLMRKGVKLTASPCL